MLWTKHQIRVVELTLGALLILDDVKKQNRKARLYLTAQNKLFLHHHKPLVKRHRDQVF